MRSYILALLALAVTTSAAPQPEAAAGEMVTNAKAVAIKEHAAFPDDSGPILDDLITSAEAEKRTVNLSPMNNIKHGTYPSASSLTYFPPDS